MVGPRITQILIPDLRMEFFVGRHRCCVDVAAWKETAAIHQKEIKESLDDEKCWISSEAGSFESGTHAKSIQDMG